MRSTASRGIKSAEKTQGLILVQGKSIGKRWNFTTGKITYVQDPELKFSNSPHWHTFSKSNLERSTIPKPEERSSLHMIYSESAAGGLRSRRSAPSSVHTDSEANSKSALKNVQ